MTEKFIGYEYMTITTKKFNQEKIIDIYEAFGWETTTIDYDSIGKPRISFKRMRDINNKVEINRLQRAAENTIDIINKLERKINDQPIIIALMIGIIATLVFGGGLSLVLLLAPQISAIIGGIILCIVGTIIAIANIFIHRTLVSNLKNRLSPEIATNEEKLINICENANSLLKKSFEKKEL